MNSYSDDHFYHDISTILRGSGRGIKRTRSNRKRRQHSRRGTMRWFQTLVDQGWREEYISSTFGHMNDALIRNWPDSLLTKEIFRRLIHQQGWLGSIQESLLGIGLRQDVAEQMEHILSPLLESSYTTIQLLDQAIEHVQGKYVPITPPFTTHLVHPDSINEWLSYSPSTKKTITMYNVSYSCDDPNATRQIETALSMLPVSFVSSHYFHATSWNSSQSILKRINRLKGRFCLDFGIFPGFYLSTTILDCLNWCVKNNRKWGNEVEILLFSIPDNRPLPIRTLHLEGEEWKHVTKESRECSQQEDDVEQLDDYDLVFGNMLQNPEKVRLRVEIPKTHSPPKKQLVGRTDMAERFLYECLSGCIYFQKYKATA